MFLIKYSYFSFIVSTQFKMVSADELKLLTLSDNNLQKLKKEFIADISPRRLAFITNFLELITILSKQNILGASQIILIKQFLTDHTKPIFDSLCSELTWNIQTNDRNLYGKLL